VWILCVVIILKIGNFTLLNTLIRYFGGFELQRQVFRVRIVDRVIQGLRIEYSILVNQTFYLEGILAQKLKCELFSGTFFSIILQFIVFSSPLLKVKSFVLLILVIKGSRRSNDASLVELRILKD
jgi:hypothetical protein